MKTYNKFIMVSLYLFIFHPIALQSRNLNSAFKEAVKDGNGNYIAKNVCETSDKVEKFAQNNRLEIINMTTSKQFIYGSVFTVVETVTFKNNGNKIITKDREKVAKFYTMMDNLILKSTQNGKNKSNNGYLIKCSEYDRNFGWDRIVPENLFIQYMTDKGCYYSIVNKEINNATNYEWYITEFIVNPYLSYAEYKKRQEQIKEQNREINEERDRKLIGSIIGTAALAYNATGYVLQKAIENGFITKESLSKKPSYSSYSSSSNDMEEKKYISGDFKCPKYQRTNKECREYNPLFINSSETFEICEYEFTDEPNLSTGELYYSKTGNNYCVSYWDLIRHYDYYSNFEEAIKALYVRLKFKTSMDGATLTK